MSDQMHIDSLWKRFLKGDDRAYTELYNLYIDDLFAYGMHFTTNRESVKDCIQEVFISLYKDRSKQRKVNNIKSYLFVSCQGEKTFAGLVAQAKRSDLLSLCRRDVVR